jgi:tetratricopeptide (TPR) repeat protein
MGAAVSGELSSETTGRAYCLMMSMCERLADYQRAIEWSEAANQWCDSHATSVYPGICQVHRAGIFRRRGEWEKAERQVHIASERLKAWAQLDAEAQYELGEIQLRRGDLARAEEQFNRSHELGRDPVPGLALLRLAQGNPKGARELIDRSLEEIETSLDRAPLLPARIEIAVELGEMGDAEEAVVELHEIAKKYGAVVHQAAACTGKGCIMLREGRAEGAIQELRSALKTWNELSFPYRGARTRLLLGQAYAAAGKGEASKLEFQAARATFERLGAKIDRATAEELLTG